MNVHDFPFYNFLGSPFGVKLGRSRMNNHVYIVFVVDCVEYFLSAENIKVLE